MTETERLASVSTIDTDDEATAPPPPPSERDAASSVQVAVRIRPLLAMEGDADSCIKVLPYDDVPCALQIGGSSGPRFTFDHVFDPVSRQAHVFDTRVAPLLDSCLEGYNATTLAYGQTGSGKTYTIMGETASSSHSDVHNNSGIIPRAMVALFERLQSQPAVEFQVKLQFLELYGEEIRDLLAPHQHHKLTIRDLGDDEPEVVGATQQVVQTADEAMLALTHGMLRRVTGATAMNETSSRSHAILSLLIEQQVVITAASTNGFSVASPSRSTSSGDSGKDADDEATLLEEEQVVQVKRSKFNFVDLAGSERQKRTQSEGKRLKEGIDINKGLLVLGNVISALGDPKKRGKTFVPYRDSKLTRLLKGSLGGNHKTLMIACVSPSSTNMDESLNCLRYANRAKNIQNNAVVNVDASSRLVAKLQGQVQTLAKELLRSWDGHQTEGETFSRDVLAALAAGDEDAVLSANPGGMRSAASSPGRPLVTPLPGDSRLEAKVREVQNELNRTRDRLRESQSNHDAAEEELYVAKAEKELYQLQLSVLSSKDGGAPPSLDEAIAAFKDRAVQYEEEIGKLKVAFRDAQAKASRMDWLKGEASEEVAIALAKEALELDRKRLASLQAASPRKGDLNSMQAEGSEGTPLNDGDQVEQNEFAKLNTLTKKYLGEDHDSDGDGDGDDEHEPDQDASESSALEGRHRHIQADLVELTRSIAAKEDLIDQLRLSQEKYANMRDFYEEKLKQMETTLSEREAEREQLAAELRRSKEGGGANLDLEMRLKEKDGHIAALRKKQRELQNLTRVSARNHDQILRLQSDVREMKRRKVDLQKELTQERKRHAKEKKLLEKAAMQMDREVNKWKKVSTEREVQAEKASRVAKARLEEIGHLRSKYKDAEKKLRVMSLKRGVMAKAGLDPVMIGRREGGKDNQSQTPKASGTRVRTISADSLRDHFDQKVAEVVRKEAIVDKLAQEWEEHFELSSRQQELSDERDEEAAQSLALQIQFKEDQIRQLAQRLGKPQDTSGGGGHGRASANTKNIGFLFDDDFKRICGGTPSETAKATAAKVLFGMVVRERRRIAALARTASSLDERAQAAERAAEANEEALRSYMNEQQRELAALTQSQQEQILSLMDFVKDMGGDEDAGQSHASGRLAKGGFSPKLLVLANERIALLERQLEQLREEVQTADSYRSRVEELTEAMSRKAKEHEDFEEDMSGLRSVLRQIRELVVNCGHGEVRDLEHANAAILEIINDALHPRKPSASKPRRQAPTPGVGRGPRRSMLSPRVKRHVELMHTSDSDLNEATPEWASEIMTDLAMIAEGKVPPSLEASTLFNQENLEGSMPSSPDRSMRSNEIDKQLSSPQGQHDRRAMSKEISDQLERIVVPGTPASQSDAAALGARTETLTPSADEVGDDKAYKSVFERLVSPSHYTGTQKERHHTKRHIKKSTRNAEDAASKLLDDLLQSDSDTAKERPAASRNLPSDYTQLDVFERLQRTTTQAYAVKHTADPHVSPTPTTLASASNRSSVKEGEGSGASQSGVGPPIPERQHMAGYTSQDVFERLQKTTTEAYAKRHNPASRQEH